MNKIIFILVLIIALVLVVFFTQRSGIFNVIKMANNGSNMLDDQILNLSNQGLVKIPDYVFGQITIKELNVSHNQIPGSIQAEIRVLLNLRVLNLGYNKMTGVPAEIGQLQNLEVLDLSYNQITGMPNELGNLKNLKTLDLRGNPYSKQDFNYIRSKLPLSVNIIVD